METYSEVITNKTTIDKSTHIFAPKHPKDLRSYRMVYDTISVETMNSILFDDSVIIRSGKVVQPHIIIIPASQTIMMTVKVPL